MVKRPQNRHSLFRLLLDNRVYAYYFAVSFALIFFLYSFIATPRYISTGQLLPSMSSSASFDFLQGIDIGGDRITRIARAAGLSLGATSGDVLSAVLQSRTIKEQVIEENKLAEHYRISAKKIDDIIKALGEKTGIDITSEDIVIIQVEDRNPRKAKEIVDSYIAALDNFLRESGMTKGKFERMFLEERLSEVTDSLSFSEDSFVAFQERYHIINLPDEIKMGVELYAQLKAALQAKEIELKMKSGYMLKDSPEIVELKQQIRAYTEKLRDFETKSNVDDYGVGSSVSLKDLSRVELEYFRIYREVRKYEKIYGFLVELYEQAKISEARDTPIITVLDFGNVPQRPEFPRKLRMAVYGLIIGLCVSILYVLSRHYFNVFLQKSENKQTYNSLKSAVLADLKTIKRLFKR